MCTEKNFDDASGGQGRTLVDSIRHHTQFTRDKCALSDSRTSMDYATLDRFSTDFANYLHASGCGLDDRVVILANRQAILVAAIVGTFKSGCTHVPLDPQMPPGRLKYILEDVAPALVITEEDLSDAVSSILGESCRVIGVSTLEELLANDRAGDHSLDSGKGLPSYRPDAPAYCIYTSGSTGRPKGVIIKHSSIAPFFEGTREVYDVRKHSVCASFSPLHFDVFLMDMLFPLSEGATLFVFNDAVVPEFLFDLIQSSGVTHFSAWGMMLGLIAQAEEFDTAPLPCLKTVLTGTDVPDIKTVQRWLAKNPGTQVINAYGPTEVTCASTAHVIHDIEPDRKQLYPIGKPLRHVHACLIDDQDRAIETKDTPGELLVGGVQVMQAYWSRPDETAERLSVRGGIRFYRTGDICSYLPNGDLFYHGRRDNEVNIGGRRVHLNEIQRVICGVPGVHSAEVVVFQTDFGEQILAGAVLLEASRCRDGENKLNTIRQRLIEELPGYMIPRHLDVLKQFPQLSSGKPDRKALLSYLTANYGSQKGGHRPMS